MVEEGGADEAAPEDAGEEAGPGVADGGADEAGDDPAEEEAEPEPAIDEDEDGIGEKIGDGAGEAGGLSAEEPAEMGMEHAAEHAADAVAVEVRGMGVAVAVGVLMVSAVEGAPFDDGALAGHGAEDGEDGAEDWAGFVGAVGEHAMVADGDAEDGEGVHSDEERDLEKADAVAPGEVDGEEEGEEGDADAESHGGVFVEGLVVGLGRVGRERGARRGEDIHWRCILSLSKNERCQSISAKGIGGIGRERRIIYFVEIRPRWVNSKVRIIPGSRWGSAGGARNERDNILLFGGRRCDRHYARADKTGENGVEGWNCFDKRAGGVWNAGVPKDSIARKLVSSSPGQGRRDGSGAY